MLQISDECGKPLILIGDFNAISKADDRLNGSPVTEAETQDLSNFVMESQMMEAPSTGLFYSWSNKSLGYGRVDSRIDRAYVNEAWNVKFPDVAVQYLPSGISDHSPLLVDFGNHDKGGGRPFRFQNILAEHKDFMVSVQSAWQSVDGNHKMQSLWVKLKAVKQAIKNLHQSNYSHASLKIEENRQKLADLQSLPDIHTNTEAQAEERHCYSQLKYWLKVDSSIWHQKSRISWIYEGDTNSKLFFTYAKVRRAQNNISMIQKENGDMLHTPDEIQGELVQFYKNLLGTNSSSLDAIDLSTMRAGARLSQEACNMLIQPITKYEVDKALSGIEDNKSPGLDGFNSFFFKKSWPVIKDSVYDVVNEFFE